MIELFVVMVIISVLVIISIPAYSNARDKAKVSSCMAELRDLDKAVAAYFIDHSAYPATLADVGRGGALDPWRNPYVYSPPTRKDFDFVNTDYDLYSKGIDGQSAADITDDVSKDDIFRAADGTFMGTVSRYLGES